MLSMGRDHGIFCVVKVQQASSYTHEQTGNLHAWGIIFCFVVRRSGRRAREAVSHAKARQTIGVSEVQAGHSCQIHSDTGVCSQKVYVSSAR